ncbi:hypothetical protein M3Y96_00543000 [Aphelenchoides besseyi]|nr:hypothetical protein M3Y96_00543000 [Aphelenchoides besseyi]
MLSNAIDRELRVFDVSASNFDLPGSYKITQNATISMVSSEHNLWCYVHHFCAFLTHPNPKYPSTCILFHPLIFTNQNQTILLFYIAIISYINLGLSIICSMLYRFGQAYSMWSAKYFEKSPSVYALYFGLYVLVYATIFLPIALGQEWSWEKTRVQFVAENPTLVAYFNHPMLCFVHENQVRALHLYMAIFLIVVFVIGNILYVLLARMLHKSRRNSFLTTTHRLQVMLFRAFRVQLFIAYAFILLPLIFQALLIHYRYEHAGTVTTVVILLLSIHGTVDSLAIIYFISPWRKTIQVYS